MTDYDKLVKALRCKRDDCEGCGLAFFDNDEGWMCQYAAKDDDAAAAIEALQAEVKELRRLNMELFDDLPKLGEWIIHGEPPMLVIECSVCGQKYFNHVMQEKAKYCSMCGAKMEVQDG